MKTSSDLLSSIDTVRDGLRQAIRIGPSVNDRPERGRLRDTIENRAIWLDWIVRSRNVCSRDVEPAERCEDEIFDEIDRRQSPKGDVAACQSALESKGEKA